jgi:hypothetical protein
MSVACRWLEGGDHYERVVTGWVDAKSDGPLRFTARLTDAEADVEVALTAHPSPTFEILEAEARARSAETRQRCGELLDRFSGVIGRRMVSGFRREVAALLGPGPGAGQILDVAIEAARLSRQVTRVVGGVPPRPTPREFHRLDLAAWPELADTCFTYRSESDALFDARVVATPAVVDMYAPPLGARLVFHRYKRTEIRAAPSQLRLYQSMFDQVHGFEVWYDVDIRSHEIVDARALTPRLPYFGLCEQPQTRIAGLVGRRLDGDWTRRVRDAIGGREGCVQLTDLTTDVFRLLTFE